MKPPTNDRGLEIKFPSFLFWAGLPEVSDGLEIKFPSFSLWAGLPEVSDGLELQWPTLVSDLSTSVLLSFPSWSHLSTFVPVLLGTSCIKS